MKVTIPEIAWHNRDPVFSADFSMRDGAQWRMATAGADSDVKMWRVVPHREGKDADITFLSNLNRHTNTVNCVRFNPSGTILASGGDDGALFLWQERLEKSEALMDDDAQHNKEHWVAFKMLRGHIEDVMDLSWSPDGRMIISGSIDNSAIVWETKTGKKLHLLKEHSHYVQGVTWDPLGYYLCTLSSDRSMHVYESARGNLLHTVTKCRRDANTDTKTNRLFVEEGATKYFRRLDFSPDGAFLFVPAAQVSTSDDINYTTLMFSRTNFKRPMCYLPGPLKPVCAVRCCPVLYQYRQPDQKQKTTLPYRIVYAIASLSEVYIYDTEQLTPFCTVADIHYACITDLAWSSNGRVLMITSYDGFCTLLTFDQDELGVPYSAQAAQVNSPRLTIKPESKTKKKKGSPKAPKVDANVENKSPVRTVTPATPCTPTSTDQTPKSTADACVTPKSKQAANIGPCVTPKRPSGVGLTLQASLNNKLITPTREHDTIMKRITPTKLSDVVKSRENTAMAVVVIDLSDDSNDGITTKPQATAEETKPRRRIAPTKIE